MRFAYKSLMDISGLLLLYCKSPDYFFIFVFRYKGLIVMENENKAQVKEPVKIRFNLHSRQLPNELNINC